MAAVNPYESPKTAEAVPSIRPQPTYRSRGHALLTGLWRGAKFGGTWMAIILGAIAAAVWLFLLATLVYRWLVQGVDLLELADLPRNLVMTLGVIALCSLDGAVIGALIMGTAAAVTHRKPPARPTPIERLPILLARKPHETTLPPHSVRCAPGRPERRDPRLRHRRATAGRGR